MADIFIGTKKVRLDGKTQAQLEHLRQLADDQLTNYLRLTKKSERYISILKGYIEEIDAALLRV